MPPLGQGDRVVAKLVCSHTNSWVFHKNHGPDHRLTSIDILHIAGQVGPASELSGGFPSYFVEPGFGLCQHLIFPATLHVAENIFSRHIIFFGGLLRKKAKR